MQLKGLSVRSILLQVAMAYAACISTAYSWAAQSSTIQLGAIVDNIHFEQGSKIGFVRIINKSDKPITAFNLTIDMTLASGKHDHFEQMTELLPMILDQGKGALEPGQSQEVRIDSVDFIQSIRARIDMVAYLDLDVETDHNVNAMNRLIAWRKSRADAAQEIATVVSDAAANQVTPDPHGMAIRQLKQLLDEAAHQHAGRREIELRCAIDDLKAKPDLKAYARHHNDIALTTSLHANLRRTN
jgi:hypothetical protein